MMHWTLYVETHPIENLPSHLRWISVFWDRANASVTP